MSRRIKDYYDSAASIYDEKYGNPAFSHMRRVEWEAINQYVNKDQTIVDIGCGTGFHTLDLARRGHQIVGIDISEEMLKRARSKALAEGLEKKATFLQHDIEQPLQFHQKADLALSMFGTLSHVEHLEKALTNIRDILSPRGLLIFTIVNAASLHAVRKAVQEHTLLNTLKGISPKTTEIYYPDVGKNLWGRHYTRKEMAILLKKVNFSLEKIGGIILLAKPRLTIQSEKELPHWYHLIMQLEKSAKWMFPVNYFSEYLFFVCKK